MSTDQIIQETTKLLEDEKWSKFQLSEYNLTKFINIDNLITKIQNNNLSKEIITLCNEYLKKNEFNLMAKYLLAILCYPDDLENFYTGFKKIIIHFKEREKWGLVEFLAKKMISMQEDEFGLRSLIDSLKTLNNTKDIIPLQERLLKLVPDDHQLALNLAKIYEGNNELIQALKYYKMAFKLFINLKNNKIVEDIWLKIVEISSNPVEIYYEVENLLHMNFIPQFNVTLLSLLIHNLTKAQKYNDVIDILKKILVIDPTNKENREELIKIYRLKYSHHTRLEDLLKSSGLRMWWKDINSAVELFEKQIRFDEGVYVYHYNWGCGKIIKFDNDQIYIDFEKNADHKMSFDMALNTLEIIPENHIKVLKRYQLNSIIDLALHKPVQLIDLILSNKTKKEITIDQLKDELLDRLIKSSDWQRWWNKVKKELKINQNIKLLESEKMIKFIESDTSYGEMIINKFNNATNFLEKIDVINELLINDVNKKVNVTVYQDITDFLVNFINENIKTKTELVYIANVILGKIKSFHSDVKINNLNYNEDYIVHHVEDLVSLFKLINIHDYQKRLIENILKNFENWDQILFKILFTENSKIFDTIIDIFNKHDKQNLIRQMIEETIEKYRDFPELFYFIAKNIISHTWDQIIVLDFEQKTKIYISLFSLLFFLGRQIKNKINIDYFTKVQKQIIRLLFDKNSNYFLNFVKEVINQDKDSSSLLTLFRENEYIPKKTKENIIAELRDFEKPVAF